MAGVGAASGAGNGGYEGPADVTASIGGPADVTASIGGPAAPAGPPGRLARRSLAPREHVDQVPFGIPEDHRAIPPRLGGRPHAPVHAQRRDPRRPPAALPDPESEDELIPAL